MPGLDRTLTERLRALRADERGPGLRTKDAALRAALVYPSAYGVGMSSLGFLEIHRRVNARPGSSAERAFLPSPEDLARHRSTRTPLLTLERQRPVFEFDLIGLSHAYELELTGIAAVLELAGVAPLARERSSSDPLVVLGGPITFSNPLPSGAFADLVILGEAEEPLERLLSYLEGAPEAARGDAGARRRLLEEAAGWNGFWVPSLHTGVLPTVAKAPDELLPARSELWTPNAELADMMLVEPERGCSRGCTFCVMRRSTNDGMRIVDPARISALVPDEVSKVGLVGAAVSDHPRIKDLLRELVDVRGKRIGISSLRANRLDEEFVGLLARGGYRSMTIGLDAASERLRVEVEKGIKAEHVLESTRLAKSAGMHHLKIYVVVGLPGEDEADLDELMSLANELSRLLPVKLGVSPLVPKFHTPLATAPFVGEARVAAILKHLRRAAGRRVEVRSSGAREAYVEYRLSQGGLEHGAAAVGVMRAGGRLSDWKRALAELPERHRPSNFQDLVPPPTRRRLTLSVAAC